MAIAFDATSHANEAFSSPLAWNHTCTGSNLVLVVSVTFVGTATSIATTYNGVSMTLIDTATTGTTNSLLYYLLNPSTGINSISCSFSGTPDIYGGAVSLTGVSALDAHNKSIGTTNAVTTSVTTVSDNTWIVDGMTGSQGATVTVGGSQTQRQKTLYVASTTIFGMSTRGPVTPAGSTAMSWTGTGGTPNWAQTTASFTPSPTVGGFNIALV